MILKPINKREIQGKIGVFFHSKEWKNALLFFSFVVLASVFWALQYYRQKFEFEVPVRVFYEHVPPEIAISDSLPKEIKLQVQDTGSAYLSYMIKKKRSLFVTVDLEAISLYNTYYLVDRPVLYSLIGKKLFASTQLTAFSPDKIEINYSPLVQKEVPVTIQGTIAPASGYLFSDSIRIEPDQVVVYGSQSALDTLREIRTMPLDYRITNTGWSVSADLQVPEGIHPAVGRVKLSASIEEYTEKIFEIPVRCNNLPSNRKIHFFPSFVEVAVKVGLSKYAQLSKSDFEIAVDYNKLRMKNSTNCSLTLTHKPLEVESYRIIPNVIEFLIEQKGNE